MIEPLINRTIDNRWIVLGLTLILVGFGLFAAGIAIIYCLFFHIVLPYCIYFFQNASQCPVVKTNVRNDSTTLDPFSLQRAPDTQSLCFTTTLQAASVTPLPIGRLRRTCSA